MSEAIDIRLRRARSWLRKGSGEGTHNDLDAQFIFLWIAFNALYGMPRYRNRGNSRSSEIEDFQRFLREVEKLSGGAIENSLRLHAVDIERVMQSPFLDIECWKRWDKDGIRDRQKRVNTARNVYAAELHPDQLFLRIYTLRNQLLHGASSDGGRRNRESLRSALPILRTVVQVGIKLLDKYRSRISRLDPLPYPPSLGEGGRFNVPRIKRDE
jgi:hypothetical protein